MRTTNKLVTDKLQAHILDQFEETVDYVNRQRTDIDENAELYGNIEALKHQINSMRYNNRTTYQTALDWIEGGSALIYHGDVNDFLQSLDINENSKQFTDEKSWRLYCHLVAREIAKLVEGAA